MSIKSPRPRPSTPKVPPDLMEWLRTFFPQRCIKPGQSPEEAMFYAGQAQLAATLIHFGERAMGDPEEGAIEVQEE